MTPILAIDPGASGGLAHRNSDGEIAVYAMPETQGDLCDLLREIKASSPGLTCMIEQVGGYVGGAGQPGSTMFRFGEGYGFLKGVLMAWSVPIYMVTPQAWQKVLRIGTSGGDKKGWKKKLKAEAQRRYPGAHITAKTCDALLILDYFTMWRKEYDAGT
jgi:hypothetical protein